MVRSRLIRHAALFLRLLPIRLVGFLADDLDGLQHRVKLAEENRRYRAAEGNVKIDRDAFRDPDLLEAVRNELVSFPEQLKGGPAVRLPDVLGR